MQSTMQVNSDTLSELFANVADTGELTQADRYGLMTALLDDSLTDDEAQATNRLLRAVKKGQVKIVD
jgi:hypothetical protein